MQKVSEEYKKSMKNSLRERGYIQVTFGLINQEAQANARISSGQFAYYSRNDSLFGEKSEQNVYATLEEDFTKVDGSMFFPPRQYSVYTGYDTGLVGDRVVGNTDYSITIDLHILPTDIKGLTLTFGENYPIEFDIVADTGETITCTDNNSSHYSMETTLTNVSTLTLVVHRMKNLNTRFRLYAVRFGYGLVYHNNKVLSSTLESYVSPIGADLPQIDFEVTLENTDGYFNVDNPNSAINYFETGQEIDVAYGYESTPGNIEWVKGTHVLCSEWESDDSEVVIRGQDVLRLQTAEYYKGRVGGYNTTYWDLATTVFNDMGISSYYIDPRLKELKTEAPIPRVTHKEALQLIANACRCVLSQDRDGRVEIKSFFIPSAEVTTQGTYYSDASNIVKDGSVEEYATLALNYTTVDGSMRFLPRNAQDINITTGYTSQELSDGSGKFATHPVLTIKQAAICMYYGIKITFGETLPSGMIITTYLNNEPVDDYVVTENISQTMVINHRFDDFETMTIEFTGTAEPYNRIVVNRFSFGDIAEFTMERRDMTSSPRAIKQELVKEVVVPYYLYRGNPEEESLLVEDVEVTANEYRTFFLGDAAIDYRITLNDATSTDADIYSSGAYYVEVRFKTEGSYKVEIFGHKYQINSINVTKTLNNRGKSIKWDNPLVSKRNVAVSLCEWLADYYSAGIEYEYTTRGNPEIDANDIVYQENSYVENMKVNIYKHTIKFDSAFSGSVTARRVK